MSVKHLSLLVLVLQNTALSVVMHHSRLAKPADQNYYPPTAVLLTELLKCAISLVVALRITPASRDAAAQPPPPPAYASLPTSSPPSSPRTASHPPAAHTTTTSALAHLWTQLFSHDCWKLSIPAILYVLQNNLQFIASANLEPPVFICAYQLKIITTALFSILLLRKRLGAWQWGSLAMLTVGVAMVQLQSHSASSSSSSTTPGHSPLPTGGKQGALDDVTTPQMEPFKGFLAVLAACFTSGLAGVYFELVLKTSTTDLWIRNVQLSLFSLFPASLPVLASAFQNGATAPFAHFGLSAWSVVALQVIGGLAVALVIKHADNILKGFAVSFSILLSFAVSVVLFEFPLSLGFGAGAALVGYATFSYGREEGRKKATSSSPSTTTVGTTRRRGTGMVGGDGSTVSHADAGGGGGGRRDEGEGEGWGDSHRLAVVGKTSFAYKDDDDDDDAEEDRRRRESEGRRKEEQGESTEMHLLTRSQSSSMMAAAAVNESKGKT